MNLAMNLMTTARNFPDHTALRMDDQVLTYAAMLGTDPSSRPDVTSLRVCISGGAAMPVEVMRQFEDAFGCIVLEGYWQRPEETAATIRDGWLATGDMARADEDGYLYIVDRKKDLIIRGGYNVYPREVEEVLYEHPAVAEAAVVGIPHASLGEEIGAAVVLKPWADVSSAELSQYVKSRLAAYKYPRRVWLMDSLPKGPTGKILRREVAIPPEADQA